MSETGLSQTVHTSQRPIPRPSYFNKKTAWLLFFLLIIIWSIAQSGIFSGRVINERGFTLALRFLTAAFSPELSLEFLTLTLEATLTTLAFAVCGVVLSLLWGTLAGILASEVWWETVFPARNLHQKFRAYRLPWLGWRGGLASVRAIHEVVWGLFLINIIGLDPLTAILAIAIPFGAITAKVYSEILDEAPRQSLLALKNSGVSPAKAFLYTIIPLTFNDWLSYAFYRFECAIRAAAVLGIIGAGGLGHEIFLSFQTLKYTQIWTLLFALFLLNGLTDFWSALLRRRLGRQGHSYQAGRGELSRGKINISRQDWVVKASLILMPLLILFSFWYVDPTWSKLFSARSWQNLLEVLTDAFPADFSMLTLSEWLAYSKVTVAMSVLAVAGAGFFALFLSFPAANNFLLPGGLLDSGGNSPLRRVVGIVALVFTRGVLLVMRSVPPPIWALIMLFVFFPGIMPGAMALGLYTLGVLGRLIAEVVENLDERPMTALKAQGATAPQIFAYGVFPLTAVRYVAYLLYRWEETIRATVVIGLVGAGGLGWLLVEQISSFDYQAVMATLIIFVILTVSVDLISQSARRTLR